MSIITIIMMIGTLSSICTLMLLVYVVSMYVCGIDVVSVIRCDKLLHIERIHYRQKTQCIVDVSLVRTSMSIRHYSRTTASEWGIEIEHTTHTWVKRETATYAVYTRN